MAEVGKKAGGGGAIDQGYDENGRYVAKSGVSDSQIMSIISSNPEYKQKYDEMDEDDKKSLVEAIRGIIDSAQTDRNMEERNEYMSEDDFEQFGSQCDELARRNGLGSVFHDIFRSSAQRCFNFQKALRIGYAPMMKWYNEEYDPTFGGERPWKTKSDFDVMSMEEFERSIDECDRLMSEWSLPKGVQGFRLVNEDYLCSMFPDIWDGVPMVKSKFGYDTLDRSKISVKEMAERLGQKVGHIVRMDGGYSEFSCLEGKTHMGHHVGENFRRIRILFDLPKGTKCFISKHLTESEGVLPRNTDFYVKNVEIENEGAEDERVVVRYGIKSQA